MTELLVRWFIKDKENIHDTKVRQSYGRLSALLESAVMLFYLR